MPSDLSRLLKRANLWEPYCRHGTSVQVPSSCFDLLFLRFTWRWSRVKSEQKALLCVNHQLHFHTQHSKHLLCVHHHSSSRMREKEEKEVPWRYLRLWLQRWDCPHRLKVNPVFWPKLNLCFFSEELRQDDEDEVQVQEGISRVPRFLVYWMTTTSLSTLTSYTTTVTMASLLCTPSNFGISLCGWVS